MNARVAESLAMEHRLALEDGTLSLHYQPKINMASGEVAGLEALIRWNDSELGSVPLAKFVSLLGGDRHDPRCRPLGAGQGGRRHPPLAVARPQGAAHLGEHLGVTAAAEDVDTVLDALSQFEVAPLLDLEITESVLLDDIEESTRKLQALRRAGVEVSVDDFGTGYCPQLPGAPAGRHAEDRPQLRVRMRMPATRATSSP